MKEDFKKWICKLCGVDYDCDCTSDMVCPDTKCQCMDCENSFSPIITDIMLIKAMWAINEAYILDNKKPKIVYYVEDNCLSYWATYRDVDKEFGYITFRTNIFTFGGKVGESVKCKTQIEALTKALEYIFKEIIK